MRGKQRGVGAGGGEGSRGGEGGGEGGGEVGSEVGGEGGEGGGDDGGAGCTRILESLQKRLAQSPRRGPLALQEKRRARLSGSLEGPPPGPRDRGGSASRGARRGSSLASDLESGRRRSSSSQVTRWTCAVPSRCRDLPEAGAMLGHRFMTHTHPTSAHIFRESSACLPRITRTSCTDVKRAATFPLENSTPSRLQEPGWRPHLHFGRPRPLLPGSRARTAGQRGGLPLNCPHARA